MRTQTPGERRQPTNTRLPGYDAQLAWHTAPQEAIDWPLADVTAEQLADHRAYLAHNDTYDKYLRIHKVFVGESGAHELIDIGDTLATERLPRYLDAAGWAYAEAGLVLESESATTRIELLEAAEQCWEQSLQADRAIMDQPSLHEAYEDTTPYRTALNLAYTPLMKSIILGNVTDATRERTFLDTLTIAQTGAVQLDLARRQPNNLAVADYVGFLHEVNTLLTLLYLDDPRYVPLPSTARADTGYYHIEQTHDVTVINQHWGVIKKVIPLEVKAKASARDRERYKALIVRGKMHLSVAGRHDPRQTIEAFTAVHEGTAGHDDQQTVDRISATMLHLLRLYQQGANDAIQTTSRTKFHDARYVAPYYKGLAR